MAYPERIAKWFKRVTNGKSIGEIYSESRGFFTPDRQADHVHHGSDGEESYCIQHGIDPNGTMGFPLSASQHVGEGVIEDDGVLRLALPFEDGHSMHPDMYDARMSYRNGDKYAFKKMAHHHIDQVLAGETVSNWDDGVRGYYTDKMNGLIFSYSIEHPEDPIPRVRPHKSYKRTHWTDIYFDKDCHE